MKKLLKLIRQWAWLILILQHPNLSAQEDILIAAKIILVIPEEIPPNTPANQILDESIAVFDKLDKDGRIIYIKENQWSRYKKLLADFTNLDNLSQFYLKTGVTGIVFFNLEEKFDKYEAIFSFFDIYTHQMNYENLTIYKIGLIDDLTSYTYKLLDAVIRYFPKINLTELNKKKIKKKKAIPRKNPDYEITLSGGMGLYARQAFDGDAASLGPSILFDFGTKIKNFSLEHHLEFSPLFNNSEALNRYNSDSNIPKNNSFFLYNFYTEIFTGYWFANQSFRFGFGTGFSAASYYIQKQIWNALYNYDYRVYETIYAILIFPYFSFTFMPLREFTIGFSLGSELSPTHFFKIIPFIFFPINMEFNFRYLIYKQLFIDISLNYFLLGYVRDKNEKDYNDGFSVAIHSLMNIGFGWRFEWSKQ